MHFTKPRLHDPEALPMENPKDRIGQHKPPLHLIPSSAELLESKVLALGAKKYGAFNWRESPVRASIYIAAARRHMLQWFDGQEVDSESGISHLAHARACLGIMLDAQACGKLIDDRPTAGPAAELIEVLTTKPAPMQPVGYEGKIQGFNTEVPA